MSGESYQAHRNPDLMNEWEKGLADGIAIATAFVVLIGITYGLFSASQTKVIGKKLENGYHLTAREVTSIFSVHGIYWTIELENDNYGYVYDTGGFENDCPIDVGDNVIFFYKWKTHYYEDCGGENPRQVWSPEIIMWERE